MDFFSKNFRVLKAIPKIHERLLVPVRRSYDPERDPFLKLCRELDLEAQRFDAVNHHHNEKVILAGWLVFPKNPSSHCIVYCHTMNASHHEGDFLLPYVLEHGLGLCVFDFRAHGVSAGKFSSLGYWETLDLESVLDFLLSESLFKKFILWGRSMGSVACLLYNSKYHHKVMRKKFNIHLKHMHRIKFVVMDSPYFSLVNGVSNVVQTISPNCPEILVKTVLMMIDDNIKDSIGISLEHLNMAFHAFYLQDNIYKVIFSQNDELIAESERQLIFDRIKSWDKKLFVAEGKHNSARKQELIGEICNYIEVIIRANEESNEPLLSEPSDAFSIKEIESMMHI